MQIDTACINSLGSLIIFKRIKGHWDQNIWEQLFWVSSPEGGWGHFTKGVIKVQERQKWASSESSMCQGEQIISWKRELSGAFWLAPWQLCRQALPERMETCVGDRLRGGGTGERKQSSCARLSCRLRPPWIPGVTCPAPNKSTLGPEIPTKCFILLAKRQIQSQTTSSVQAYPNMVI